MIAALRDLWHDSPWRLIATVLLWATVVNVYAITIYWSLR